MSKQSKEDALFLKRLRDPAGAIIDELKQDKKYFHKALSKYDDIDYDAINAENVNELNCLIDDINNTKHSYENILRDIKTGEEDYGNKTEEIIKRIKEHLSLIAQAKGIFSDILDATFPNGQREAAYVKDYDDYSDDYSEDWSNEDY